MTGYEAYGEWYRRTGRIDNYEDAITAFCDVLYENYLYMAEMAWDDRCTADSVWEDFIELFDE